MTRRRNLAILAGALLILVVGIGTLYASRSPSPTQVLATSPSPNATASPTTAAAAAPTSTSAPSPSTTTQPLAALPGTERFALVVDRICASGPPPFVRREDSGEVVATLGNAYLCQFQGALSPDGRRLAYWHFERFGQSALALYQGGTSTTLVPLGEELLASVVWSSDGTGVLFVAMKGGVQGVNPEYAALRTLDIATGSIQELLRVPGRHVAGFAWDRGARLTAAAVYPASAAGPIEYLIVTEARTITRSELPAQVVPIGASTDAAYMAAHSQSDGVIHYWPLRTFADRKELRAPAGARAGSTAWRPGTRELAVFVSSGATSQVAVEMWSLDGTRRPLIAISVQRGGLFFRADGSALFLNGDTGIDLATGRTVQYTLGSGERLVASVLR